MTNSSRRRNAPKQDHNKKIIIVAERTIGQYKKDDEIIIEKYAGRVLVALGKARFKNPDDDFRKPPPEKNRNSYLTRDMTPAE